MMEFFERANREPVTVQDARRQVFVKVEEEPARQLEQLLRRPKTIRSRREYR